MSDVTPMHPEVPAGMPATRFATAHAVRTVRDPGLPAAAGPLRSGEREGFLRRRLRRRHEEPQEPHDRRAGPAILQEPRPSRRRRRRPQDGRRLRHPRADPARLLRRRMRGDSASRCPRPANTASATSSCRAIRRACRLVEEIVAKAIADEGLHLLGWRDVPVDYSRPRREREGDRAAAPPDLHRQGQGRWRTRRRSSAGSSSPAR